MLNAPTFGVRLTADGSAFVGPVRLSKQSVDELDKSTRNAAGGADVLTNSINRVRAQVLTLVTLGATIGAIFKFAKNADEVALLDARLRIATRTTREFEQAQTGLQRIASRLQVSYGEVVGSFTRIQTALRQIGGDTTLALRVTELFAATLKISGASATEASSAMLQFGQAVASGRLQGDELRSLLENNSRFSAALAESLGVNVGQLKTLGEEGKLTVDKIVGALTSQASKIEAEMSKIPRTISGAITEGTNQLSRYGSELDKGIGFSRAFVEVAGEVARAIKDIADEQKAFNDATGGGEDISSLTAGFRNLSLAVAATIDVFRFFGDAANLIVSTVKNTGVQILALSDIVLAASMIIMGALSFDKAQLDAGLERFKTAVKNAGQAVKELADDTRKVLGGPGEGNTAFDRLRRQFEREDVARQIVAKYAGQNLDDQATRAGRQGNTPRLRVASDGKEEEKALKQAYELAQKYRDLAKSTAEAIYNINKAAGDNELSLLEANSEASLGALTAYYTRKRELVVADIAANEKRLLAEIDAQKIAVLRAPNEKERVEQAAKLVELLGKLRENQLRLNEVNVLDLEAAEKKREMTTALLADAKKELDSAKERAAAFGKTKAAILDEAIAREKARLAAISFGDVNDDEIAVLRERIKLLEQARDLERDTDRREKVSQWFKDQADAAKKSAEQINESLTDALFRAFEAGDSFGKAFFKNLANLAKTTILKPTIEFVMSPVRNAINNFFGNMIPGGGGMPGMPGGGGGGFNFMNLFGMGGSGTAGGLSGIFGGGAPVNGGEFYNVPGVSSPTGMAGGPGFMAQAAPFMLAALAGAGIGRLVGRNNNNRSTAGGAAGATIGMAVGGPIGAAIGAILGGLAADRGGAKTGGSSFQQFDSAGRNIGDYRIPTSDNGRFYTPSGEDGTLRTLTSTMAEGFFAQLTQLGGKINGPIAFGLGFDKDPKGSADNRISGQTVVNGRIVRQVQDRSVGKDDATLQKELSLEIQRSILAGLQASELPKAIADLLKSVNVDTAGEEEIKKVYETALIFKRIIDQVGTSMKGFTDKLVAFKDAAPETLNALGSIFEYIAAEPFAALATESMTLADTWRSQGNAIRDLIADFDGSELSIQRLGQLTATRYQTEMQLANQVMAALQNAADVTANSIRNIRLSVLDDQGKYGFLDKEAADLFKQLGLADDPATINNLVQQLNDIINQAFGLLSPEEQARRAEEFINRLNEVSGVASERLQGIKDEITGDKADDLPTSIRNAIRDAMDAAADKLLAAAGTNQQAADTLNAGANTFAGAVANATGQPVGSGGGGSQVGTFDGVRA